jgi:hypothetical protein
MDSHSVSAPAMTESDTSAADREANREQVLKKGCVPTTAVRVGYD